MCCSVKAFCFAKEISVLLFLMFLSAGVFAQDEKISMDFRNQKTVDVLFAISSVFERSIIPDETVSGNVSLSLRNESFDGSLSKLTDAAGIFFEQKDDVWYASRIKILFEDGKVSVECEDVNSNTFIKFLSRKTGSTIMCEGLPNQNITIRMNNTDVENILELLCGRFDGWYVEKSYGGFYMRDSGNRPKSRNEYRYSVSEKDGKYSVSAQRIQMTNFLTALFSKAGKEYSFIAKSNPYIENVNFQDKEFEEVLNLVLGLSNFDYSCRDGIFYIFERVQKDYSGIVKSTYIYEMKFLDAQTAAGLLPAEYTGSNFVRVNKKGNSLIISGTDNDISSIKDYLAGIDVELALKNVRLKYIKSEELLKYLPADFDKTLVAVTNDSNSVFFTGSEDQFGMFQKIVDVLDQPKDQIIYKLLVVQYQNTSDMSSGINFVASNAAADSSSLLLEGGFEKLLSLNFDVISQLGFKIAGSMSHKLSDGSAKVLADTTLNGLSGQDIVFDNKNIFRYRDEISDSSGAKTSVVKEISTGLGLKINGWVSGDDMITVTVSADISKQTTNSGGSNIPSTSQKNVRTTVRTKSGEPVIISGLMQQEQDVSETRVPFLGRIPVFGNLFKKKSESESSTELVIYLVPDVEKAVQAEIHEEDRIRSIYEKYVAE